MEHNTFGIWSDIWNFFDDCNQILRKQNDEVSFVHIIVHIMKQITI